MLLLSDSDMHRAVTARDARFDGQFYYGVLTTGVFCRPSCGARPARAENIRFFATSAAAIESGLRPCKRCKPLESSPAALMAEIAAYIDAHADEALSLDHLAERAGLSPGHLQKKFKAALGISPKAYHNACRFGRLKAALRQGDDIAGAIFEAGYGSTSRLYGDAIHTVGMTPSAYRAGGAGETIAYACRTTVLGPLMMAATDRGVCFAQFGTDVVTLVDQLHREFPRATLIASSAAHCAQLDAWIEALDAHLSTAAPRPNVPLDLRGTAFQILVWQFLLSIKEGDTVSYSTVAHAIGRPKAVRAVASSCAANRIAVLIPCHRVLRSDGSHGGYRWGGARKQALLDQEQHRSAGGR